MMAKDHMLRVVSSYQETPPRVSSLGPHSDGYILHIFSFQQREKIQSEKGSFPLNGQSSWSVPSEMERLTGGVRDIILYPSQADKTKSR